MVQPLGHSTSGSHERYKPAERLKWEEEHDPIMKMREWILENHISDEENLERIEREAIEDAREAQRKAWKNYASVIRAERDDFLNIVNNRSCHCRNDNYDKIASLTTDLKRIANPIRRDVMSTAKRILRNICIDCPVRKQLQEDIGKWLEQYKAVNRLRYSSLLYNESKRSTLKVKAVKPVYSENSPVKNAREILQRNFDYLFAKYPLLVAFGEDTGKMGM